jgi:aldose 1-epimerase
LTNSRLGVQIMPEVGGGLARFDWHGRGEPIALMRACEVVANGPLDPNYLACYPLVPWSNRIAERGFVVDGRRVELPLNRNDDPFPIHGSGWQRAWQPQVLSEHEALLVLHETSPDTYSYRASMRYLLDDDALRIDLQVINTGAMAMPFGLGLHPFFPRHGNVALRAPAPQVWINDGRSPLPVAFADVPPAWDFGHHRPLDEGLNHCFRGWTGDATISWPDLGLHLHVEADVDAFVLYTPVDENFFCFEPVDHPINAVHLPGGPQANGMTLLAPEAGLRRRFVFRVVDEEVAGARPAPE